MTFDPLVSLIITNYNYGRFLPRLFASLMRQTFDLSRVEVIFVDDGSSDNSLFVAESQGRALQAGSFEIVTTGHLGNPAPVRNLAFSRARGRFLACLDADDFTAARYLQKCVQTLEQNPKAGYAYYDYVFLDHGEPHPVILPDFDPDLLRTQNIIHISSLMRREVWEATRGFRQNTTYEDWEFWVQTAAAGFFGVRVPEPLFFQDMHGENYSREAIKWDGASKAAIVLNNKDFFHTEVVRWAKGVMAGEPWAHSFKLGLIPRARDVRVLQKRVMDAINKRIAPV